MKKLRHILALVMAGVILFPTSGLALHSIKCLMTGEQYYSVGKSSCCCGTAEKDGSKKCCDEETTIVELDRVTVQKELNTSLHPIFYATFVASFLNVSVQHYIGDIHFLHYLKNIFPPPDRDVIVLVQSFLI